LCSEQPQKAELRYLAEAETRVLTETCKPTRSDDVVDVPLCGEGDPHFHIKEKE
jgi:hypothetical protein